MTKKRRIYQIGIALLLCFMQTAGIAMYGQNRPRAAAKRIHRLQADSLNAIRQAARIPSDSLGLTMDEPVLHQAVTSADSIATADSIAAENKKKLLEMTSAPALEEPEAPTDSLKREINPKVWVPNPTKATWLALVIPGGEIRVTKADCPDQLCVLHGPLAERGGPIVCLPNHLSVQWLHGSSGVDAVSGTGGLS